MVISIPSHLSDDELESGLKRLAAREREMTTELDACLAELKARGLPAPEGLKAALDDCEAPNADVDAILNRALSALLERSRSSSA